MKTAETEVHMRKRWALCAALLGLSLLLLGAGRMNGEIKDHMASLADGRNACLESVRSISAGIPVENRKSWETISSADPVLFIKASHGELHKLQTK